MGWYDDGSEEEYQLGLKRKAAELKAKRNENTKQPCPVCGLPLERGVDPRHSSHQSACYEQVIRERDMLQRRWNEVSYDEQQSILENLGDPNNKLIDHERDEE